MPGGTGRAARSQPPTAPQPRERPRPPPKGCPGCGHCRDSRRYPGAAHTSGNSATHRSRQGGAASRVNGTASRPSWPRSLETLAKPAAPATWLWLEGECQHRDIACPGCAEPRNSPAAPGAGCAPGCAAASRPARGSRRTAGKQPPATPRCCADRVATRRQRRLPPPPAPLPRGSEGHTAPAPLPAAQRSAGLPRDATAHPSARAPECPPFTPPPGAGGQPPRRSHQLHFPLRYLSQDGMRNPLPAEALSQCNKCPPGRGGRRRRAGGRGAASALGAPRLPLTAPRAQRRREPAPPARARERALLGRRGRRTAGRYHQLPQGGVGPLNPPARRVGPAGGGAVSPGRARWWRRPAAIDSGGAARCEPLLGPRRYQPGAGGQGRDRGRPLASKEPSGPGFRSPQPPPGRCGAAQP